MLLSHKKYDAYLHSLSSANALARFHEIYEAFKAKIYQIALVVLLFTVFATILLPFAIVVFICLVFPLTMIMGLYLKYYRRKFRQNMKKEFEEFCGVNDYVEFKHKLAKLSTLSPKLQAVNKYTFKKVPFGLRFVFNEAKKMSSTLLTYESWLNSRLDVYNKEQFKSDSNYLVFKSEKELWKEKNPAYSYWM